jgi:hypothetical protein
VEQLCEQRAPLVKALLDRLAPGTPGLDADRDAQSRGDLARLRGRHEAAFSLSGPCPLSPSTDLSAVAACVVSGTPFPLSSGTALG